MPQSQSDPWRDRFYRSLLDNLGENSELLRLLGEKGYKGPVTIYPHSTCFAGDTRESIVRRLSAKFDELWSAAGIDQYGRLSSEKQASGVS